MNQAARNFPQIRTRLPTATRNVLNRMATLAERDAINQVASDVKLAPRFVRNRYDVSGRAKESRTRIRRASTASLSVTLDVYVRGLPVFQVAGMQIMTPGGGVKAQGRRFYKGAFKSNGRVFKRRTDERLPLMMPKIGLRVRLRREFNRRLSGVEGRERFRAMYREQIRKYLARYGVRA